ncbi:serine hydrolase domain-containing protein [Pseudemcibacter aquimaris]|uniref:serine hydrolase domain-containing protein n=1 Tax=Pseudemcibacter aquimaris TaxID=2857064 RepID=UPI00201350E0|nr:serine hydrolase domain-containing protein [Pseudemcibacter aquimaris]MCC3859787.1 beta-lactamase family protein [Pseudemcibacter aquimaris]WDU60181.1 beta-lactamase family protein [Pseudemcibacter aquimaris]
MRIILLIQFIFLFTHISITSYAQNYDQIENSLTYYLGVKGETAEKFNITERMNYHDVPGVTVAIVENDEIAWVKSYGVKSTANGEAVTKDTVFQSASISKPLSAIAALRLVEEGLLSLDEPINNYLKRWKISENELTKEKPVTLRMILTHTAGLTISGFPGYGHNVELPTLVQIVSGKDPANTDEVFVENLPGSKWNYSGGGYTIAQMAMEDVTGLKFPEIMQKYVIEPFGMEHSSYEINLSDEKLQNIAFAHDYKGQPINDNPIESYHLYPEMAAASLWTNPTDLAKALKQVNKIYHQKDGSILSKEMATELFKIHQNNWGIGFRVFQHDNNIMEFGHTGSNEGYKANFTGYTDGRGILMLTNGENGGRVMNEIFYGASNVLNWSENPVEIKETVEITNAIKSTYHGTYTLKEGTPKHPAALLNTKTVSLNNTSDGLFITFGDFIKSMKLYRDVQEDSKNVYFVLSGHKFTLDKNDQGLNTVTFAGRTYIISD